MNQNFKRKLMAGLLSACMIFQTAGIVPVYAAENAADNIVTLAVEEVYAVYDGGTFYAATADAPTVPTTPEKVISDKKTINHLYIMGASVPKELMLQSTGLTSVAMPSATTIGFQAFDGCTGLASVAMPSAITIDGFAFSSCTGLTSVAMPNATGIGKYAFLGCTGLTSAQLPKVTTIGDNAFSDCINLASVEMPSATSIGNMAFSNCQKLAKLTLGATPPATVGTDVFKSCPASRTLTIPGSLDSQAVAVVKYKAVNDGNTGDELWYGWTLPSITPSAGTLEITAGNSNPAYGTNNIITLTATFDKATNIGKQRASTINKVEFKDGATSLGTATANATQNVNGKLVATLNVDTKNWAVGAHSLTATFAGNEELVGSTTNTMTVTVNEVYAVYNGSKFCAATVDAPTVPTTTEISDTDKNTINHLYIMGASVPKNLMLNCTNLKTVNCADTVTTIDIYAFSGCTSLTSVEMPAVITININAFYGCTKLTRAAMPSATSIGNYAFWGCTSLTSVKMPAVTTIGEYAFYNCTTLASVEMPKVTTIGDKAFHGTALTSVSLPSVTTIGINAFEGCTGLTSVAMPKVTKIVSYAFNGCTGLASLTLGATPPATVSKDAFTGCPTPRTLTIQYNPDSQADAVAKYKAVEDGNAGDELWYGWTLPKTINEVYAVYDGIKFYAATKADPSTVTADEITDKKTINHLYIMGAIVPDELMLSCTNLKTVTCANTVTEIGYAAFGQCTGLTSVAMPNVAKIGNYAFKDCAGLTSVEMPNVTSIGDYAFAECTSLVSAVMPKVTTIGQYAFHNCANLTSVATPEVTTIGNNAFYKCTGLASVEMPMVTSIGNNAFKGCTSLTSVELPKVETISEDAFSGCIKLAIVSLPEATLINNAAFSNCTSLTSANLPKVTSIDAIAFNECTNLASVEMPNVTTIGTSAFNGCAKLTRANLPNVTKIGNYAFKACAKLESVEMPNVTSIGIQAFHSCAGLKNVAMPKATSIGEFAFKNCTGLISVAMPKVTSIYGGVFSGCTSLAIVAMPNVTTIGTQAFYNCTSLTSANLPSATSIGNQAFWNCTTLASLTLGATPPTTVGADAFLSCPKTNALTIQGNTAYQDTVLAAYNTAAGNDGTADDKWYGWALPTSLNGTGVSNSAGTLTTAGTVTVNYGTDNTITFTASFAKFGENKLKTLAENQISLLKNGAVVESKTVTLTGGVYSATFTVNTKDFTAGNYNYTATFDGNRSLVGGTATETVTVTINKIDQAVLNISEVPNKTYGDSTFTLSTTGGSGDGAVTYAVTAGSDVVSVTSAGEVTVLKAGAATITATKDGDTNYNAKTGTAQITVATATPTLTWGSATQSVTYTGSAAVITAPTATGVTGGTTPNGTISYTYEKKSSFSLFTTPESGLPVNAGTYTVTAHIAAEGNYTAADSATMELTIEKSTPTLAISTMNGKTYDGMVVTNPTVENMTITGVAYAAVTFAYSKNIDMSSSITNAPKDAGTYYVQASVVAGDNTNAASSNIVSFTITQAPLTVTGGTVTQRQYNGGTSAAVTSLTLNGLVNGETLALTTDYTVGAPAYDTANAGTGKTVTGTAALASNAKTGNYTLTGAYTITGQTISKATGLAAPTDGAMDDTANTFTFTPVTNYADVTAYEYSMDGGTTWTNVSANPISVGNVAGTIKIRIKATTNYEASAVYTHSAAFTATLEGTVAITGTATYGETLTATVTGQQTGAVLSYKWLDQNNVELQSGTSNTLKVPGSAVGKTITVEVIGADYDGKLTAGPTAAVAKKAVTATAGAVSKVYNGQTAATVSLSIAKANEGDEITVTAPSAVYNDKNVGTNKAITLGALTITGTAADWYTVTAPTNVTGTITVKPVTVKADDKSMTTGGTLPTFTVTYTGFVGTENDSNAALTTPAVAACSADGKTAGTFDITLSTQPVLNDTIGKNYTIASQTTGTLTVSSPSSGGGTVTPPAPKPEPPKTDPGTGNTEVSVPVKPITKGDTSSATVPETAVSDAIDAAEKEAAKTGGSSSVTVTVDAPEGAKTVETTLPSKSLSAVAEGKTEGLKISTPVADLSFDSEALKNIAGMAGKDVKISATQVDTKALTDAQKSQVGDAPVFDFTVTSGDKTISNFNGGTATVSVPYTPKEGENPEFVTVWLLDDAGKLIPIEAKYKDGKIAFETGHFSRYAIGYLPFTDVKADWAYESIVYVYQNKLFSGVGENKFAPTDNMNRAMLWTVLYRMAGSPGKTETPANWYADAQAWAIANGISDGTNPDGNITREQLATILFRYAKAAATAADMSSFIDTDEISGFAKDGMSWAVERKILQGNSGKLIPQGNATRAEVAAVLSRYVELVIDKATA